MKMSKKPTGSFRKVKKLVTVLQKCNSKAVIGDSEALISPGAAKILVSVLIVILAAAVFVGAYVIQPYLEGFVSCRDLASALMLILLVMSFVLAIKDIINVLYVADDLAQLLPMPFSAGQIVLAKLVVVSIFPFTFSFLTLNTVCFGYGIRAGAGLPFIIGIVLSGVCIPLTGISAATLLIVVIFRLFGFIRNRDIIVAAGGIAAFVLTFGYIYFSNRPGGDGFDKVTGALGTISSVSSVFPNISFMNRFMFEGDILGPAVSLVVPAVLAWLGFLAVKAFYFDTALSMQNTGTGKKTLSKEMLQNRKKNSALKALTLYEGRSAVRNPAYLIYGFAISFLWPLLFVVPMVLGNDSFLPGGGGSLNAPAAMPAFFFLGTAASCFSCGFNILARTAFSREGSSFSMIRSLPVDMTDYFKSKRNFALTVVSCGSVLYVVIAGIAAVAAGFISVRNSPMILIGAGVSFLLNVMLIDLMLMKDSGKPQFHRESETELSRKLGIINVIAIVAGVFMLAGFMVSLYLGPILEGSAAKSIVQAIVAVVCLLILFLSLLIDRAAARKVAKNLTRPDSELSL